MKVLKFGGTSVGSVESLLKVKEILKNELGKKIVVCSAMSGVTDQLVQLLESIRLGDAPQIELKIERLRLRHQEVICSLITDQKSRDEFLDDLNGMIRDISKLASQEFTRVLYSRIITYGETLLTSIFSKYLNAVGIHNTLLLAKDFMFVDSIENPNIGKVSVGLRELLSKKEKSSIYITQGFVCRDAQGEISNLSRGGSDFTATIIAAAVDAEEVQIWTDIDGLHNNDPRYVNGTKSIPHLSYNEAEELAHFGAKILHANTVFPVVDKKIPILLKSTFDPNALGTVISDSVKSEGLKAISAKDNIMIVELTSKRKLISKNSLQKILRTFDEHEVPVHVISSSRTATSVAIDNNVIIDEILKELENFFSLRLENNKCIISIVGEHIVNDKNLSKFFEISNVVPIKMISFGVNNNISILVDSKYKVPALEFLNKKLFALVEADVQTVLS